MSTRPCIQPCAQRLPLAGHTDTALRWPRKTHCLSLARSLPFLPNTLRLPAAALPPRPYAEIELADRAELERAGASPAGILAVRGGGEHAAGGAVGRGRRSEEDQQQQQQPHGEEHEEEHASPFLHRQWVKHRLRG